MSIKWTSGRLKERERFIFFWCPVFKNVAPSDEDWEQYFLISEQGKGGSTKFRKDMSLGLEAIITTKRWQDITMNLWQDGVLDGSVPYFTLLGGEDLTEIPPRSVVEFMKRDMFGGLDAKIIENLYQEILACKA